MPIIENISFENEFFSGLDENNLYLIRKKLEKKKFSAGEIVIWEGDISQEMYFIKEGWLKVIKSSEAGREIILHLLGPNDMFNALAAFVKFDNPATVISLENSILFCLSYENMAVLLEQHPVFSRQLLEKLAMRLHKLTGLIGNLSLRTVEARLAELLLKEAEENIFVRQKWLTQTEMAALLGTVPDVLNRILNNFVEMGFIEFDRYQIKIINRKKIEEKAGFMEI